MDDTDARLGEMAGLIAATRDDLSATRSAYDAAVAAIEGHPTALRIARSLVALDRHAAAIEALEGILEALAARVALAAEENRLILRHGRAEGARAAARPEVMAEVITLPVERRRAASG